MTKIIYIIFLGIITACCLISGCIEKKAPGNNSISNLSLKGIDSALNATDADGLDRMRDMHQPSIDPLSSGWMHFAPRAEIAPEFEIDLKGGRGGDRALIIKSNDSDGQSGWWKKTFQIIGGHWFRFSAFYRATNVSIPRRSIVARLLWQGNDGQPVPRDTPAVTLPGETAMAEPEYPSDLPVGTGGWTQVTGLYRAPANATQAVVELSLRWAPNGRVAWSQVSLAKAAPQAPRKVRLAAVHFRPTAGNPQDNPQQFAPLIEDAARQQADLVVLPEVLTFYGTGKAEADCAEPVPGPSTEYFGGLAKKCNLYIVAGLIERDGPLIYNVAVLIGPDGKVQGKYRKVALPRDEVEAGIQPGSEYPVFETRFGRVGMMVCYDGFFPEVARQLTINGAEVIAWPVWDAIHFSRGRGRARTMSTSLAVPIMTLLRIR